MAMTDATKRKEMEPEADTKAPTTVETAQPAEATAEAKAQATPASKEASPSAKGAANEPEAKRLKAASAQPAAVRKQVEYYLSDENLRHDKFFSEKIASGAEGWLEMSLILSCNKMKTMRATKEDVVAALKDSKLELKEDGSAVRRPGNAPLPKLEAKPQHLNKKNSVHAHDGGVVAVVKGVPAEQSWMQVKEQVKAKLPEKVNLWFVSEVNDKGQCFLAAPPFEGDVQLFQGLEVELGGVKMKAEVCYGEQLQQTLKTLPKHIRDKREKESRKRQKERNRPIVVGSQKFVNVGALRGKVKEILNSRSDGEALKPEGTDFKLIKALLEFHPKGAAKREGMKGIKVGKSPQGDTRCFYLVKEGGAEEDVSMKKCIDAVELNPPYVTVEKKGKDEATAKTADAAGAASSKEGQTGDAAPPTAATPAAASDAEAKPPKAAKVEEAKAEAAPGEDKAAPGEDKAAPGEDKAAPGEDKVAPGEDKAAPGEDKAAPSEDKAAPVAEAAKADEPASA